MGEKGENPTKTSLAKVSQSVMSSCASDIYSIFITELSNLSNSFAKYPCHTELILVTTATTSGGVLFFEPKTQRTRKGLLLAKFIQRILTLILTFF